MKNAIKFIHLSDIHLGVETHGKINPATGKNTRLEDVLRSLDSVVNTAINESVDLVLIAGDVFHRENPHPTEEIEFAKRVGRLVAEAGAKVIIALGNHDYPAAFGKAAAVEIFPALSLDGVSVARKPEVLSIQTSKGVVQVACLPWARTGTLLAKEEYKTLNSESLKMEMEKRLIGIIRGLIEGIDKSRPALFLGHIALRDAKLSGTEDVSAFLTSEPELPVSELSNSAFCYAALGHIHKFQNLNQGNYPPIIYSGSIERIDFSEEREKKGFVIGEISEGRNGWECDFDFVETPARRFLTIELNEILDEDAILARLDGENVEDAVVRLRYNVSEAEQEINEKKVREALCKAYSVKIERIFENPKKMMRRTEISKAMDIAEALEAYIASKPELKNISEDMKKYAKELARELEDKDA